jgi:membrane-associated phospholipid phosphatase
VTPPDALAPSSRATALRPVEWLILGYGTIVVGVILLRTPAVEGRPWLLVAHALIYVLLWLFTRPGLGAVGRGIREAAPLILLFGLYSELDLLNFGITTVHDGLIQRWEAALFGGQPSREWWRAYPSAFWSFVLHAAYISYYIILSAPAAVLAMRGEIGALRRFILMVIASFVFCYLFFIFFPVAGPYYAFPRPTGPFVDNVMARIVYGALETGSSYGAAFPSSHVAATIAALIASWRASRQMGLAVLVPAMLLTVSVVYCQMHYAIDALAGLLVGIGVGLVVWLAERRGVLREAGSLEPVSRQADDPVLAARP